MLVSLLIIADDLTGAVEAGVLLAKHGVSTAVVHDFEADLPAVLDKSVHTAMVFNTESRHIGTRASAWRVENAVRRAADAGVRNFFKKTDSTMRGNIGAELKAFMHSTGCHRLPFVPAHPTMGRFTRAGQHYVGDKLLHCSAFACDPLHPIESSYIPEMHNMQTGIPVHSITIENRKILDASKGIMVFDCRHPDDLRQTGLVLKERSLHRIMAGSSAMVDLLPELLCLEKTRVERDKPSTPALLVNGSVHPISLAQVARARDAGIETQTIPPGLLAPDVEMDRAAAWDLVKKLEQGAADKHMVILASLDPEASGQDGHTPQVVHEKAGSIGSLVEFCMQELPFRTLVVFGGDTLMGVMRAMGCASILPRSELLPGVSNTLARVGRREIHLVTKPGGYGREDIILKILKQIAR